MYSIEIQYFYRLSSVKLLYDNGYNFLRSVTYPRCLYISRTVICLSKSHTPNLPLHLPLPSSNHQFVSVSVLLYTCICIIFLIPCISDIMHYLSFFCLVYFTKHNILQVHLYCWKWQNFILFRVIFLCLFFFFLFKFLCQFRVFCGSM